MWPHQLWLFLRSQAIALATCFQIMTCQNSLFLRHPVSSSRPKYQTILTSLLQDPKNVLQIPLADASSHSSACILGSPLEAGLGMYTDLQCAYIISDSEDLIDSDYEYMYQDVESDS